MAKQKMMFVSAFVDIGRGNWSTHRVDINQYLQFMEPLLLLIPNLVIFAEGQLYDHFVNVFGNDKIKQYQSQQSFLKQLQLDDHNKLTTQFQTHIKPYVNEKQPHPVEYLHPSYNILQHNKVWLLQQTKTLFPDYTHYTWIDLHYLRFNDIPFSFFSSFSSRLHTDRIYMGTVSSQPLSPDSQITSVKLLCPSQKVLLPSTFTVPTSLVEVLFFKYEQVYEQHRIQQLINNDSAFHTLLYHQNPSMYEILYLPYEGLYYQHIQRQLQNQFDFQSPCQLKNEEPDQTFLTEYYERLFHKLQSNKINMFAIGNWYETQGNPFPMWKKYFHHKESMFYGANMNVGSQHVDQIKIHNINQFDKFGVMIFDKYALLNVCESSDDVKFDIMFDSFSHEISEYQKIFENSFFKLQIDGIYIIEHYSKDTPIQAWYDEKVKPFYPDTQCTVVSTPSGKQLVMIQRTQTIPITLTDQIINRLPYIEKLYKSLKGMNYEKYLVFSRYLSGRKSVMEIGTGNYMNLFLILLVNQTVRVDYLAIGQYDMSLISQLNELFEHRIHVIPFSPLKIINGELIDTTTEQYFKQHTYDLIDINLNHMIGMTSVDMRLFDFLQRIVSPDVIFIYNFFKDRQVHSLIKKEFQILEWYLHDNYMICRQDPLRYQQFREECNMYIITSVIYEKDPSTAEQRLRQTLETLQTIKQRENNALVFIVEGSEYNWYANQFSADIQLVYSPPVTKMNKQCGEVLQMISCLQSYAFQQILLFSSSNINRIFKITGRYSLTSDFVINEHSMDMTVVMDDYLQRMYTHLFSFSVSFRDRLLQMYKAIEWQMKEKVVNMEEALYQEIRNSSKVKINNPILIGVQGTSSSTGVIYRY